MMHPYEYRRRVFNHAMLECFGRIQEACCEIDPKEEPRYAEMAKKMSDAFYTDMLNLETAQVKATKEALSGSCTFLKDCVGICESIATDKMAAAQDAAMEIPDDQKIELSDEDEALIDKLFDEKSPTVQIDAIRDATVKSLVAENDKAQEIKNALEIAQSQVSPSDSSAEVMEETVSRLENRGPTSLMNAILNNISEAAIKDVHTHSEKPKSPGEIMSENADEIKNRAIMLYSLYEASSVFGVKAWTPAMVKAEAERIYYRR